MKPPTCAGVAVLALCLSSPLSADWLSLKDGNLIETKGAWREKGKTVVYTSAVTNQLLSVRASEVDLKMSSTLGARMHKVAYVDLGETPDPTDPGEAQTLADPRGDAEKARLQKFVQDPSSPRVAGTLSASSNDSAASNLSGYLEGADDAEYRSEVDSCSRFEGSNHSACLMRAGINSELRKETAARKEEAAAEVLTPVE